MFVYVAAASAEGPCKIGSAIDPHRRLRALQTGSARSLSLYMVEPIGITAKQIERAVHEILASRRAGGGKEWFDVAPAEAAAAVRAAAITANSSLDDNLSLDELQTRTILAWVKAYEELRQQAEEADEYYEAEDREPPSFLSLFAATLRPQHTGRFDFNDYLLSLSDGMWLRWAFERLDKRLPTGRKIEPYIEAAQYLEEDAGCRERVEPLICWIEWSAARELTHREAHHFASIWDEFAPRHNRIERYGPQWATYGIDDHVDDVHVLALRGDERRGDRDRILFVHQDFRVVLVPEKRIDLWGDREWRLNLNPLKGIAVSGFVTPILRSGDWRIPFRPWLRGSRQRVDQSLHRFLDNPAKRYPVQRAYDGIQPQTCVWCQLPSIDQNGHY